MSPLAPLLAAFFLAPVPTPAVPPAFAIFAKPDEVMLVLYSNRSMDMRIADPRDVDGLAYSLMFIRVRGPDGELVWGEREGGWWSPEPMEFRIAPRPEPWTVAPGETVTIRAAPTSLTRGLDGPTMGSCRFQARAILRDYDKWPWNGTGTDTGIYTVESNWADIPCTDLFPSR